MIELLKKISIPTIFTLIGILIGMYIQQKVLSDKIDALQKQVQEIKDDDLYWIKQWIHRAR